MQCNAKVSGPLINSYLWYKMLRLVMSESRVRLNLTHFVLIHTISSSLNQINFASLKYKKFYMFISLQKPQQENIPLLPR